MRKLIIVVILVLVAGIAFSEPVPIEHEGQLGYFVEAEEYDLMMQVMKAMLQLLGQTMQTMYQNSVILNEVGGNFYLRVEEFKPPDE